MTSHENVLLDFYTNKTKQYLQLRLEETSCVACISGETQTRKISLLFGRDRLYGQILASVWHMEGNFEVLKRCYKTRILK